MSLSSGMMVVRAMVLGRLDGLFTSIHERVLYPSHRLPGGEGRRWGDVNPRRLSFTPVQSPAYLSTGVLYTPARFFPYSLLSLREEPFSAIREKATVPLASGVSRS
jgi:hypothetical protein